MLVATKTKVYALDETNLATQPTTIREGKGIARVSESSRCTVIAFESGDLMLSQEGDDQTLDTAIKRPIESLLILSENPLQLLVGTEGPHLFRVTSEGAAMVESFEHLECRENWYTPWGGPAALRSLAQTRDGWVYADIHVGSIMRSPDYGKTWQPVTPDLHEDVHQVTTSFQINERVYANTANAVYISDDRGRSWQHRSSGLRHAYGRAISVHPQDPECILATVSKGPHGNARGRLYRTDDAGYSWEHVTSGFPESAYGNIDTFHVAHSSDGAAWAVVDTVLYRSGDKGRNWQTAWEAPEEIQMIDSK
jgi:hypothetical protein